MGPSSAMSTAAVSGPSSTRCGFPTSTVRARRSSNSWGWSGSEPGRAHVDAGRRPPGRRARRVVDGPRAAGGGDREARRRHQPGIDGGLGQAADAVAAHLGLAPVGVVQLHGEVAPVATGADPDDPVGTDAAAPVGQQADLGHREPDGVVGIEHDQEVVARALVLGGPHHTILAGWGRFSRARRGPAPARSWASSPLAGPGDPGVAAEPGGLAPGELAGAPHRLLQAVVQGRAVLDVGQQLAVAERLAGRPRDPGRAGRQRPHLVDAGRPPPWRRSAPRCGGRSPRVDREAHLGRAARPGRPRARARRSENGRPDPRVTSRARTTRRRLVGSMRAAPTGSSAARRACRSAGSARPSSSSASRAAATSG